MNVEAPTLYSFPLRPLPRPHSFQFSPRFRLITSRSLRLPLSEALLRYPLHFTLFSVPPSSHLCLLFSVANTNPPFSPFCCLPHCLRLLKGSFRASELCFFDLKDRNLLVDRKWLAYKRVNKTINTAAKQAEFVKFVF